MLFHLICHCFIKQTFMITFQMTRFRLQEWLWNLLVFELRIFRPCKAVCPCHYTVSSQLYFLVFLFGFAFWQDIQDYSNHTTCRGEQGPESKPTVNLFLHTEIGMSFSFNFWEIPVSGQEENLETFSLSLLDSVLGVVGYYGICLFVVSWLWCISG